MEEDWSRIYMNISIKIEEIIILIQFNSISSNWYSPTENK